MNLKKLLMLKLKIFMKNIRKNLSIDMKTELLKSIDFEQQTTTKKSYIGRSVYLIFETIYATILNFRK
jgi:hypothetical protein